MGKLFIGYSKRAVYLLFGCGIWLLLFSFFGVTTTSDGETLSRGGVAVIGVIAVLPCFLRLPLCQIFS